MALLIITIILVAPALALALSPSKVTLNFMCPCGTCDEALSTCECPQSDGFRSQIAGMVGRGDSEEQIIQDFKGRFGPDVLIANAAMAPDSGGWSFTVNKRTFGFILLAASFSLVAFSLGRYMSPSAPTPKTKNNPSKRSRPVKTPARETRKKKSGAGGQEGEELLEDHEI